MSNANIELVHRLHGLFNEGRLPEAAELVHADMLTDFVAGGQQIPGRDGFVGFMSMFKTAFPDLVIRTRNEFGSGDSVVIECEWTGTHRGPLVTPMGTIPATGRRVEKARFCEVYRIRDGRIASMVNYQDLSTWMRGELGL
jgi:steroid delta-isomerase-like uncharacterized protein